MTHDEALQALNAQWAAGDITPDQYELERAALEYAHGEQQSAMEREEVTV